MEKKSECLRFSRDPEAPSAVMSLVTDCINVLANPPTALQCVDEKQTPGDNVRRPLGPKQQFIRHEKAPPTPASPSLFAFRAHRPHNK